MSPALNIVFKRGIIFSKISLFLAPFLTSAQTVRENTRQKLDIYFSKDRAVKSFVSLTRDSLLLYASPKAKATGSKPEIALSWKQVKKLSRIISQLSEDQLDNILRHKDSLSNYLAKDTVSSRAPGSLKGLRVAIDPGHIGGTYAMGFAESRCMTLQVDSAGHADSIRLVEGNLTFYTAQILKKKLEEQGAIVMFARKDTGISALDITYDQWKQRIQDKAYLDSLVNAGLLPESDVRLLHKNLTDKDLFKYVFGSVDMAERAKKMNAFKPDISVIIHYNVNENNLGWTQPTDRDFVMAFVGGCLVSKDLQSHGGRLNFLRLLIGPDIDNSVSLSSKVVGHLATDLVVPLARKDDATYLSHNCLTTPAIGVYSRDLALTRLIRGTLVYGEALYQDNSLECCMLSGKNCNCKVSQRISDVANAYYKGIVDFVSSQKK